MLKQIQNDMIQAMKDKDIIKKETLRLLISDIKNEMIKLKTEINEKNIIKIIKHSLKSREDAIKLFQQAGRNDLVDKAKKEIGILKPYLPKQFSRAEIEKIVSNTIHKLDIRQVNDTGRVIKDIMARYSSRLDGRTVKQIVSAMLSKRDRAGGGKC